ncbi:YndM family protein [Lentibacillus sp. N15]|uniref:YndM family protein n=1 Tax=Lentibacillus songyuanensis TaxID=3136161 RepID=UPI0031BAB7A9
MQHLKALGLKFLAIAFTIYTIFGIFTGAGWVNLFWISLFVTVISYLIGDMIILRQFGNITATIADFALTFLSLFILGGLFLHATIPIITTSILSAFFISCVEPFIHGYIVNRFSPDDYERKDWRTMNQLQTEFGEETNKNTIKADRKDENNK